MSLDKLNPEQLRHLYDQGGFYLISDFPAGSEFGIDGSIWQVQTFAGVKLIPPGLHLVTVAAPVSNNSATDAELISQGIGLRKACLIFSSPRQIVAKKWVPTIEDLVAAATLTDSECSAESGTPHKRRKVAEGKIPVIEPITSKEYLQSIDHLLAPYPFEKLEDWESLTNLIDDRCLARVVGFDQSAEARLDSLTPTTADPTPVQAPSAPLQWGKPRPPEEGLPNGGNVTSREEEDVLHFVKFNLKKSWPSGAVGQELTRHSRDKSWLLQNVLDTQLNSSRDQLLAEMQLAFIFFTLVQNHSALEAYKSIFRLICRAESSYSLGDKSSTLMADLLSKVLLPQLEWLRPEFFTLDLPELEIFLIEELNYFRDMVRSSSSPTEAPSAGIRNLDENLLSAWKRLSALTNEKYGWSLMPLDRASDSERKRRLHYDLLREKQGDDDDLLADEEDEQPVVVVLE